MQNEVKKQLLENNKRFYGRMVKDGVTVIKICHHERPQLLSQKKSTVNPTEIIMGV